MTTPLKVTPGDPVHFATRIDADTGTYTALCGYIGFNALMFSNDKGIVKKSLGGVVTCEKCREKMGVVRCDGGGWA